MLESINLRELLFQDALCKIYYITKHHVVLKNVIFVFGGKNLFAIFYPFFFLWIHHVSITWLFINLIFILKFNAFPGFGVAVISFSFGC